MLSYLDSNELLNLVNKGNKLIIANNIVYDITEYYIKHPGGKCILKNIITIDSKNKSRLIVEQCDIDFNFHSKNSKKIWAKLAIGTIKKNSGICYLFNCFKKD